MKKLLLISAIFIFACSSDIDGTDEFLRIYEGQFEINNVSQDDFWCWGNTGTIEIRHQKMNGFDEYVYQRTASLSLQGSCNLPFYYRYDYGANGGLISSSNPDAQTFWTRFYAGGIAPRGDTLLDYTLYCEVTSFESSNLSAVSNTIQGVIKQSSRFTNGTRIIGTFTATLQ